LEQHHLQISSFLAPLDVADVDGVGAAVVVDDGAVVVAAVVAAAVVAAAVVAAAAVAVAAAVVAHSMPADGSSCV